MTEIDYCEMWQAVFGLSSGNQWVEIPAHIKSALGLPHSIGISGGMLMTRRAAEYANQTQQRINNRLAAIEKQMGLS